ncbi:MAG: transposase, partial [Solobacterium sp.]|nr:transposase [Solobacterium sp.]
KHLSHANFFENEMQFLISAISYNIFHIFQNTILKGNDALMTMNSFRLKFQKIAVKVTSHARKLKLSFSSAYQYRWQFMKYWNAVLQI